MNRKILLGCGVVLLMLGAVVAALWYTVPKLLNRGIAVVKQKMTEEMANADFEAKWKAPTEAPGADWFPADVARWKLKESGAITGLPELRIERAGWAGTYQSDGKSIAVTVIPASDLERETLVKRVHEVTERKSGSRFTTTMGNRTHIESGPMEHTRTWALKEWFFLFRTSDSGDPEPFARDFLKAIDASAAAPSAP